MNKVLWACIAVFFLACFPALGENPHENVTICLHLYRENMSRLPFHKWVYIKDGNNIKLRLFKKDGLKLTPFSSKNYKVRTFSLSSPRHLVNPISVYIKGKIQLSSLLLKKNKLKLYYNYSR